MLILSRKQGETFFIGEDIEISVLEVRGDRIKIGISAPDTARVIRSELKDTLYTNLAAAQTTSRDYKTAIKNEFFKQKEKEL